MHQCRSKDFVSKPQTGSSVIKYKLKVITSAIKCRRCWKLYASRRSHQQTVM